MYIMYVDESGDAGMDLAAGASRYFALSGFILHENTWLQTLDALVAFRRGIRAQYGLRLRDEIHAADLMRKGGPLKGKVRKDRRLMLLRDVIDFQATLPSVNVINVIVDKQGKAASFEPFDFGWGTLLQRFHHTVVRGNFPAPKNPADRALVIVDQTHERRLRNLTRKVRRFNPIASTINLGTYRNLPMDRLIDDPIHRNSQLSYFVQLSDVNAYFLYQHFAPNGFVKRKGGRNYIGRLLPILCKHAAPGHKWGIKIL